MGVHRVMAAAAALLITGCSAAGPALPVTPGAPAASKPAAAAHRPPRPAPAPRLRPRPVELVTAGPSATYVLAATHCGTRACFTLTRAGASGLTPVSLPRPARRVADGGAAPDLVFASAQDGYLLADRDGVSQSAWVTTDGARSWRPARLGGHVFWLVATDDAFYAITATCRPSSCWRDRLGRSPAGAPAWRSIPLAGPRIAPQGPRFVDAGAVALAAYGSRVWVYRPDRFTVQVSSNGGRSLGLSQSTTAGGVWADLTATSPRVVWCQCGTGMLVALVRSTDGGLGFSRLGEGRTPAGTSGFLFAALGDRRAMYSPGLESRAVELSTDGGRSFRTVGRLPVAGGEGRQWVFRTDRDGLLIGFIGTGSSAHDALFSTSDGGRAWRAVELPAF